MAEPQGITEEDIITLIKIYEKAEKEIIEKIEKTDLTSQKDKKLLLNQIKSILVDYLAVETTQTTLDMIDKEWTSGIDSVDEALNSVASVGGFRVASKEAVEFIATSLSVIKDKVKKEVRNTLSESYNIIRDYISFAPKEIQQEIVNRIATGQATGKARKKISKEILDLVYEAKRQKKFDETDIKSIQKWLKANLIASQEVGSMLRKNGMTAFDFVNDEGKKQKLTLKAWSEGMARNALRTSNQSAVIYRAIEREHDLLRISKHSKESPMCRPWGGKIVSISGENPNYPSLRDATFNGDYARGGINHRFCRHSLSIYIETNVKFD